MADKVSDQSVTRSELKARRDEEAKKGLPLALLRVEVMFDPLRSNSGQKKVQRALVTRVVAHRGMGKTWQRCQIWDKETLLMTTALP